MAYALLPLLDKELVVSSVCSTLTFPWSLASDKSVSTTLGSVDDELSKVEVEVVSVGGVRSPVR